MNLVNEAIFNKFNCWLQSTILVHLDLPWWPANVLLTYSFWEDECFGSVLRVLFQMEMNTHTRNFSAIRIRFDLHSSRRLGSVLFSNCYSSKGPEKVISLWNSANVHPMDNFPNQCKPLMKWNKATKTLLLLYDLIFERRWMARINWKKPEFPSYIKQEFPIENKAKRFKRPYDFLASRKKVDASIHL